MIHSRILARALAVTAPVLALGLTAPTPVVAQTANPSTDLASVQRHLQSIRTMTADFTQTDRTGKTLTGVLTLKQPGNIRFQYQKGVPILIVAEGGALTFIDYSVNQVQRWPIKNSPLGVLLDPARDISRYAKVVQGGNDRVISVEAAGPQASRIWPDHAGLRARYERPGGSDAAGLGPARQPGQSHHDPLVQPALRCPDQRRSVPLERPAEESWTAIGRS